MKPKIGDLVKVIDWGEYYSSYEDLAKEMKLIKWKKNVIPSDKNTEFLIINSMKHQHTSDIILAITDGICDFLIGQRGVEVTVAGSIETVEEIPIKKEDKKYFNIENLYL